MTTYRFWDGRTVHLGRTNPVHDRREFDLALTAETAAHLASFLTAAMPLVGTGDDIREVRDALDFVLIADEASVEAHRRMKAGRGMTPDGGYREPNDTRYLTDIAPPGEPEEPVRAGMDYAYPDTAWVVGPGFLIPPGETQAIKQMEALDRANDAIEAGADPADALADLEETDAPEHAFEPSGLDMSRCKIYVGGESGHPCWKTKEEHPNAE